MHAQGNGGVYLVPAFTGLGAPHWDPHARGAIFGLTRDTGIGEIVTAGLQSVCFQTRDLLDAMRRDGAASACTLRIDGGMSENPTFVQALANATGKPVEVSRHTEATTVGAAYLAGLAVGVWSSFDDIAGAWKPRLAVEPNGQLDRSQWASAVERSRRWIPDLSALDF